MVADRDVLSLSLQLLYKSLLGGMGSSRVVETLARTGGFGVHVSKRRLLETLQHFMEVVDGLDSLRPRGKGHLSSVRVRLLHAAVRRRLLQLERRRPGYFDAQALGVPINDLHCIGTVAAYSAALVYMALPYQGVSMSAGQAADYLALWRWVGHLLGAPVDWMASPDSAKAMMESLMAAELDPSEKSRVLVSNVLTALADAPGRYSPRAYLAAQAYCLNGDRYARALGIPRPSLFYLLLFYLQSALLMAASHSYAWLPVRVRRKRDQVRPMLRLSPLVYFRSPRPPSSHLISLLFPRSACPAARRSEAGLWSDPLTATINRDSETPSPPSSRTGSLAASASPPPSTSSTSHNWASRPSLVATPPPWGTSRSTRIARSQPWRSPWRWPGSPSFGRCTWLASSAARRLCCRPRRPT